MKELHSTPQLWLNPGNGTFLSKINNWKNELEFWKQEAESLGRILMFGALHCSVTEKEYVQIIGQSLSDFCKEQIPSMESAMDALSQSLQAKAPGYKFRKLEEKMEQLRTTYYTLKMKLLPFFPKFMAIKIW